MWTIGDTFTHYRPGCAVAVGMSLCIDVIVKSTAYDIMFMLTGVVGGVMHVDVKECGGQKRAHGGLRCGNFLCKMSCR